MDDFVELFVANFDKDVDLKDLEQLFCRYGFVKKTTISRNPRTGESEGCGTVKLKQWPDRKQGINQAIEDLNGTCWRGHRLKVSKARRQEQAS